MAAPAFGLGRGSTLLCFISMMGLCAELLLVLMFGLKSWSHVVYIVISFALLGYGLGSTFYVLLRERVARAEPRRVLATLLAFAGLATFINALAVPGMELTLDTISTGRGFLSLALIYGLVALPFAGIGFTISWLFSLRSDRSGWLYFWDLLGASLGAVAYFPLVSLVGPFHALVGFSAVTMGVAAVCLGWEAGRRRTGVLLWLMAAMMGIRLGWAEPEYEVDRTIGWEWIPGHFPPTDYEEIARRWHPMGRTDLHRMTDPGNREVMARGNPGTFEICVSPRPEFCVFSNSYRGGTPVYALDEAALRRMNATVVPFSEPMESPYVLLERPRVLVIGAGGGRDVFMAKVHGAEEVVGAEINPGTWAEMSRGGAVYDYSGRIYDAPGVKIHNVDGRHLVRNQPDRGFDLIVLNGVDTFAALSSGAYAYAENYLYTREAILDYLRVLKDGGLINFNRWFESDAPRESLRLFVMAFDALRRSGARDPREHVILGNARGWGIFLVKRTPFTRAEEDRVLEYFARKRVEVVFSPSKDSTAPGAGPFRLFARRFAQGREREFLDAYWAEISPVTDDSPFFYKYYRFTLRPRESPLNSVHGSMAFYVQAVIVLQSVVFIVVFLAVPLMVFRRRGLSGMASGGRTAFAVYFACLGLGFILIELSLMQQFVLLLGSPVYSIPVILAALLLFAGLGSVLQERWAGRRGLVPAAAAGVVILLLAGVWGGGPIVAAAVALPLAARVALSVALLAPLGVLLGVFFPAGLRLAGARHPDAVAWAWGINSGFTVLGSTLAIVAAQFLGFRAVLLIAAGIYLLAVPAYALLSGRSLREEAVSHML